MLVEFFKRLATAKWLPWLGMLPLIAAPLIVIYGGETWRGLGVFLFIASAFLGVAIGTLLVRLLGTSILKNQGGLRRRMSAALSCFGFLFLPPLVGSWTNSYMNTEIEMHSLNAHFVWACVGAGSFFCISPSVDEK